MGSSKIKVFISYAHSSDAHNQYILELVKVLRSYDLTVLIDKDVTTPQGPKEGWPKWMKRQIKDANWILIFFDGVYRRRYDGEEEPDKGLGATWEGAIITHQLYRDAAKNDKFIPLLSDCDTTSLIPDELSGATFYRIPKQSVELAVAIVQSTDNKLSNDKQKEACHPQDFYSHISLTRLRHISEYLFGREKELALLNEAWNNPCTHIVTFIAWGGIGKTALIAHWSAALSGYIYDGAFYFDWSFYSQGTSDQIAASSDMFIKTALLFFNDKEMAESALPGWSKGARLAQLVAKQKTLLILDGIESLQHPPGPLAGQLKDPAITALLKGLAQNNLGLCVVTTRERLTDLNPFSNSTVIQVELQQLSVSAGIQLFKQLGVHGTNAEFKELIETVNGHALTLNLLGRYLVKAHGGDIRKSELVRFAKADEKIQGGHAFRMLAVYERWLSSEGEDSLRGLAILRLLGLFDRPTNSGCIEALRKPPIIEGLTDNLVDITEEEWNLALSCLIDCDLVSVSDDFNTIDTHPLIREYFAEQVLKTTSKAWTKGHRRLYEYLFTSTRDKINPTLEDLQPLYQAVSHGCKAGMHVETLDNVFIKRILKGTGYDGYYSSKKLGAYSADLSAAACFFKEPWKRFLPGISQTNQAWLLSVVGYCLRSLGRLREAVEPVREGLSIVIARDDWRNAAAQSVLLCELEMILGNCEASVKVGRQSLAFAERNIDATPRMFTRTDLADALHKIGKENEALALFREAEIMQAKKEPECPLLYSLQGFYYCDLLLSRVERSVWRKQIETTQCAELISICQEVEKRANQSKKINERNNWLIDIALDNLTLGRINLYLSILISSESKYRKLAIDFINIAVNGLRAAGTKDDLVCSLLTKAFLCFLENDPSGANTDLNEAQQIAEQGAMRLYRADVHLYRGRLFKNKTELDNARIIIQKCGYWRRKEELEDAYREIK